MEGNYNYSLSDLATVTGGNGFGNGNSFWVIILFFLICNGGWGNGRNRGNGDFGQYATAASQQEILFGQQFQNIDNKIDRLGNGIADATFALNNSIKDGTYTTTNAVKDTAYATGAAVANEGRNIQMQLAQCCCDNKQATAQVRYDMANFAASINSNIDNKFAALEKSQLEQRLADQATQINQLQLAQAMCGIPRVNNAAWGTYMYPAPAPVGCGCNCGNI
ncbi:MAG: hypothetical protein MJ095_00140 [Oscillospiraceae bacterium]|nr:hypothetical protein [Oscillospiraceae bacterium]